MRQLLERQIEQTCSDWLALDGWRTLKTDPVSRAEWGKGFGEKGMADRLYIRYQPEQIECPHGDGELRGRIICLPCLMASDADMLRAQLMWIEWKRPKGRTQPHQLAWHCAERRRGAFTLIAGIDFPADIEGFQEWYRKSSLRRSVR